MRNHIKIMDRLIEKKKGFTKKHLPYAAGGLLLLLLLGWIIFGDHTSTLRVDKRTVTISEVVQSEFNDYVRVNGQVQPITVVQLSPLEGGIVEEKVVEEGAMVKKGDVIIRLSNSQLNLSILDSEASLAEKENFLRNTRVTMEQEKLRLRQEMMTLILDEARQKRKSEQYTKLFEQRLVPEEEYLCAIEDYDLAKKQTILVMERQEQDSIFRKLQVDNMEVSLENMKKNMALTYERLENLNVKSPITGQLGSLDIVLGQSVVLGYNLGQINDLSDYKIEANIDEHYIDRVKAGLEASFDRNGTVFNVLVRKVYPDVKNGSFKTDLVFTDSRPDNIRAGQTYYINLQLGQPTDAIMVPRGAFYQATGGNWVFVVSEDGSRAYRRDVRIGRQNPLYYEILEGLQPGEKVITSGYDTFGNNQALTLK